MKKRTWLRLAILVVMAVLLLVALDNRLMVRKYEIVSTQIDMPVRLAVLTDFHESDYGEECVELVKAVRGQQPDVVLMAGDMFADGGDYTYAASLMTALAAEYPCYYVTGNHEYWTNEVDRLIDIVRSCGVTVLNMDRALIEVNGQKLQICGIPDPYAMNYSGAPSTRKQLRLALQDAEEDVFTILMAHRPELIEVYAEESFDLVLSGHAHGGQIRIPLLVNGLFAPNQGFFPEYAGGRYQVKETTLIVSRGLSTQTQQHIPRVFNRPELVIVDLK